MVREVPGAGFRPTPGSNAPEVVTRYTEGRKSGADTVMLRILAWALLPLSFSLKRPSSLRFTLQSGPQLTSTWASCKATRRHGGEPLFNGRFPMMTSQAGEACAQESGEQRRGSS